MMTIGTQDNICNFWICCSLPSGDFQVICTAPWPCHSQFCGNISWSSTPFLKAKKCWGTPEIFQWLSNLQLGDKKVTKNHLEDVCLCFFLVFVMLPKKPPPFHTRIRSHLKRCIISMSFKRQGLAPRLDVFSNFFVAKENTDRLVSYWLLGDLRWVDGFWVTLQGGWLEHQGCAKKLCNIAFLAAPFRSLPKFLVFPVII